LLSTTSGNIEAAGVNGARKNTKVLSGVADRGDQSVFFGKKIKNHLPAG